MHDNRFFPAPNWGHIIGTSSVFVKIQHIGLCFTDGKIWPSKISNSPQKMLKGGKHGHQNF